MSLKTKTNLVSFALLLVLGLAGLFFGKTFILGVLPLGVALVALFLIQTNKHNPSVASILAFGCFVFLFSFLFVLLEFEPSSIVYDVGQDRGFSVMRGFASQGKAFAFIFPALVISVLGLLISAVWFKTKSIVFSVITFGLVCALCVSGFVLLFWRYSKLGF